MTFEEFFAKKKIDLAALQQGDATLFSEFKLHFERMGEKSFDHTKKYWFNKLRKLYHLAAEVKVEKLKAENQLAEQTVTDELRDISNPAPKVGFTPRFKSGATKPAVTESEDKKDETSAENKPKVGFTPRFKAGVIKPSDTTPPDTKSDASQVPAEQVKNDQSAAKEDDPAVAKPKVGFTPRFKAGVTKPSNSSGGEVEPAETPSSEIIATDNEKPKVGFTPRFKAGVTKPVNPTAEEAKPTEATLTEPPSETPPSSQKPTAGFIPRFKAGVTKPAEPPVEETKATEMPSAEIPSKSSKVEERSDENKPKIGFTPRFKAGVTKNTPPPPEENS